MSSRRPALMLLASAVAALVVGCGGDNNNSGPSNPAPPAGQYKLVSIQNPPNTTVLTPPVATGSLVLGATTYDVTISIQGQDPVVDQGPTRSRAPTGARPPPRTRASSPRAPSPTTRALEC